MRTRIFLKRGPVHVGFVTVTTQEQANSGVDVAWAMQPLSIVLLISMEKVMWAKVGSQYRSN